MSVCGRRILVDRPLFLSDSGRASYNIEMAGARFCSRALPRLRLESFVDFGDRAVGRVEVASEAGIVLLSISGGRTWEVIFFDVPRMEHFPSPCGFSCS